MKHFIYVILVWFTLNFFFDNNELTIFACFYFVAKEMIPEFKKVKQMLIKIRFLLFSFEGLSHSALVIGKGSCKTKRVNVPKMTRLHN